MIVTDGKGRPLPEPARADFATAVEYLRAHAAWRDKISALASAAFSRSFRRTMRDGC